MSYRPLPKNLTIKKSGIEGLGIFAVKKIRKGTVLGMSHYVNKNDSDTRIIRTPLGGFINHSLVPNCKKYVEDKSNSYCIYVATIRDIAKGDEITLRYDWYQPKK